MVVVVCLISCIVWMCPGFQQRQGEAAAAADNGRRGHTEQLVHVPRFATRSQLSDLRIQLALLDRDFDYRGLCFPSKNNYCGL